MPTDVVVSLPSSRLGSDSISPVRLSRTGPKPTAWRIAWAAANKALRGAASSSAAGLSLRRVA